MLARVPRPLAPTSRLRAWASCLLLVFALSGVPAPVAGAAGLGGGNPLTEGSAEPEATTSTPTTTTTATASTETSNTKSSSVIVIALGAAVVLLAGITFVIIRDVRRVAPADDAEMAQRSSANDAAVALRRRRAKAKAARQARKRNR
jgi:hypothetical protein